MGFSQSGTEDIVFSGSVVIASTVGISNWPVNQQVWNAQPVGISGSVSVTNSELSVNNFPAVQAVSGTITSIVGNWPATFGVSGSVQVGSGSYPTTTLNAVTYNIPAPVLTSGQSIGLQGDVFGNTQVNQATHVTGENQALDFMKSAGGYAYVNYTTANTGVQIKTGTGLLGRLIINTPIAAGTVALYDNTSAATPIALITLPGTLNSDGPIVVQYECLFAVGLYMVSTGTNLNVTVCYI